MNNVSLLHGDCLSLMDDIQPASVDLVLCDPPYGITACQWDNVIPLPVMWDKYRRILKPDGVVVLTASQPFTSEVVMSNRRWFRYEWIWEKDSGSNFLWARKVPLKVHESVLVFSPKAPRYNPQMVAGKPYTTKTKTRKPSAVYSHKGSTAPATKNAGVRFPRSVQRFNRERGHHPTQKPVTLMRYMVETYTAPGDLVLDNCMGSGTAGVAAVLAGRRFIGMEMDAQHFETARRRIGEAANDPKPPEA